MPDNQDNIEASPYPVAGGAVKSGALGLGERLRSARKARAMSLEHVSETLHLDETIILALEDERFDVLGAPVFVRGHLKAYARLVGLSPDSVLEAFHESEKLPDMAPTISRDASRSVSVNPVLWSFWGLVILLGLGLGIYLLLGDNTDSSGSESVVDTVPPELDPLLASPVPATPPTVESQSAPETFPAAVDTSLLADNMSETRIGADPGPESEPLPETQTADSVRMVGTSRPAADTIGEPVAIAADRPVRLSLYFTQESWVEISDAERRLLFGLQREGRRRELTGEPPFALLLGNADGVEIRLNDETYAIPESRVSGKVARFEITRADIE
jgi:cytoskeleton protein RodZ